MVEKSRLDLLLEMIEQDPGDDFTRYGLALEFRKLGQSEEALLQFEELIRRHPDYIPAYFMSGQYLAELNRPTEAVECLRKGIAIAQRQGENHAAAEMQDLLETLECEK